MRRWETTGIVAAIVIVLIVPLYLVKERLARGGGAGGGETPSPTFVGRESCADCHHDEYERWVDSHHDLAMDVATGETVLGDFDDAEFESEGIVSRFNRKDDRFWVHTQGPDGEMGDWEITHVFGFYPLQQYLIPMEGGRLQCLTIAWDEVRKQWYTLPNHTNDPGDWLHWTKAGENWNGMCADCHSTNLKKNYDPESDTFATTWSEIDVSCEACHGPASEHVTWADKPDMARPRIDNFGLAVDTREMTPEEQLDLCARCHARRTAFEDYVHTRPELMDHMIPQLLREGLYHADGQILEEVYVYGSFIQSKMYQRGVRCADCHDVHSLELHAEGNGLCAQCHRADVYDTADHHFHKALHNGEPSAGDDCVSCHMPEQPYMGIDLRADHSIRNPRPDLSGVLGTPNACNSSGCHADKSVEWAAGNFNRWYGIKKKPHFGTAFTAGREGDPEAQDELIRLADDLLLPPVVRSTALSILQRYPNSRTLALLQRSLADDDALVRHTAISVISVLDLRANVAAIVPLLDDPVRAVRAQAALSLTGAGSIELTEEQRSAFDTALGEYREAMLYSADFPFGRYNLGNLHTNLGEYEQAVESYRAALEIDRQFFPAKNNLALAYNRAGRNDEAESLLRDMLEENPDQPEVAYSLGLLLVEMKRAGEAVEYMESASAGMPAYPRIHYNLGLLLQQTGRLADAEIAMRKALALEPDDMDYLFALADHYIKRGMLEPAKEIGEKLVAKYPSQRIGHEILEFIRRADHTAR